MHDFFADVNSITQGKNTVYIYVDQMDAPAAATVRDGMGTILINRGFLEQIRDETLRTTVERGLRVHEGFEVVFGEIAKRNEANEKRKNMNKSFYHMLENIVGDVYIEAKGENAYPGFSKYLSVVTGYLQELRVHDVPLRLKNENDLQKIIEELLRKAGIKVNADLIRTTHALYEAARFGDVSKRLLDAEVEEDLHFIVPRIFLARRAVNIAAVIQAADEIYYYLDRRYGIPPELSVEIRLVVPTPSSGAESSDASGKTSQASKKTQQGEDASEPHVPLVPWKSRDQVKHAIQSAMNETEAKLQKAKREGFTGGLLGGSDHAKLTPPTLKDAEFYLATIKKHGETIRRLQALFKRLAGKRGLVPAHEGDLNLKPATLQQAYVDSFDTSAEEHNYYLTFRYAIPDVDLVLACDQSGSTYGTAPLFSEASICILEAARRVGKIRTAAVSFGDGIRILKDFPEPVEAGRFYPAASGGTPMAETLQQALKFNWRRGSSIRRALVLATDGYPDSWQKVRKPLEELKRMRVVPIALCVGLEPTEEYRKHFEQVYTVRTADDLTETFIQTFINNALIRPTS
jgi:hypothetical protein